MKKWARKFFCCGSKASPVDDETTVASRNSGTTQQRPSVTSTNSHVLREIRNPRTTENPNKKKKKFAKIKSAYQSNALIYSDIRPQNLKDIKYNCPICFRFFNRILSLSCCQNYLCHFCAEDMNSRVINNDKVPNVSCPFCSNEDVELTDVDPKEKVKRYTDSPYSTFGSRGGEPIFNNTLNNKVLKDALKSPGREDSSPLHHEGPDENPRYASDGFLVMKREFEKSLRNPIINSEDEHVHEMSRTAELARGDHFYMPQIKTNFRHVAVENAENVENKDRSEISEESFNDRDGIDVIREVDNEQSMVRESTNEVHY